MASTMKETYSVRQGLAFQSSSALKTTSIGAKYSDLDLLIREYFLASPSQRAKLRKLIFQNLNSWQSILAILSWSQNREASDAYDGAVDLLAECRDINLFRDSMQYLDTVTTLATYDTSNGINKSNLSHSLEVLMKGIACAYKIPALERFIVIQNSLSTVKDTNKRNLKASFIDALLILSDEIDIRPIRVLIGHFVSDNESDEYIRDYANEALQEIV